MPEGKEVKGEYQVVECVTFAKDKPPDRQLEPGELLGFNEDIKFKA